MGAKKGIILSIIENKYVVLFILIFDVYHLFEYAYELINHLPAMQPDWIRIATDVILVSILYSLLGYVKRLRDELDVKKKEVLDEFQSASETLANKDDIKKLMAEISDLKLMFSIHSYIDIKRKSLQYEIAIDGSNNHHLVIRNGGKDYDSYNTENEWLQEYFKINSMLDLNENERIKNLYNRTSSKTW